MSVHVVDALINTYLEGDYWKLSWLNEATHGLYLRDACPHDAGTTIMRCYRGTSDLYIIEK